MLGLTSRLTTCRIMLDDQKRREDLALALKTATTDDESFMSVIKRAEFVFEDRELAELFSIPRPVFHWWTRGYGLPHEDVRPIAYEKLAARLSEARPETFLQKIGGKPV